MDRPKILVDLSAGQAPEPEPQELKKPSGPPGFMAVISSPTGLGRHTEISAGGAPLLGVTDIKLELENGGGALGFWKGTMKMYATPDMVQAQIVGLELSWRECPACGWKPECMDRFSPRCPKCAEFTEWRTLAARCEMPLAEAEQIEETTDEEK